MHFRQWKRRDFITLLGGTAAWPLAARAQQAGKVWRIGFLSALPRAGLGSGLYAGFQQGMRELGYVEGQDFVSEWRSVDGKYERLPELAAELVRLKMDVLVSGLTAGVRALQQATSTIPIVMAYSIDPVGNRFVASLAHPGGNVTGLAGSSDDSAPKQLETTATPNLLATVPLIRGSRRGRPMALPLLVGSDALSNHGSLKLGENVDRTCTMVWLRPPRSWMPSRPGEFHPEPLTDPDLTLSVILGGRWGRSFL